MVRHDREEEVKRCLLATFGVEKKTMCLRWVVMARQVCVAVCCSVLQRVAVCCSVLQCVAAWCSVLQCAAVCCSVLQCVAVWLQCAAVWLQCGSYFD